MWVPAPNLMGAQPGGQPLGIPVPWGPAPALGVSCETLGLDFSGNRLQDLGGRVSRTCPNDMESKKGNKELTSGLSGL